LPSLPVHPTQLYEAVGCLAITAFLLFWLRPRKRFEGQVILSFIGLYAVLRFALEFLRADERGELLGLSTSQLLAIPTLLLVATLWPRWRKRGLSDRSVAGTDADTAADTDTDTDPA
jgi:phosphatidylglycerol:prolipoprotein diacylglycerol transferase